MGTPDICFADVFTKLNKLTSEESHILKNV